MTKQESIIKAKKASEFMTTLANQGFHEECPVSNIDIDKWEWPQGIGMYAMYRYYEFSKEEAVLQWLLAWYDRNIEKGLPDKNINTAAPMYALTYLFEHCPKQTYLDVITEWAEYILKEFPRTECGGFQHSGTGIDNLYGQLWDDTLVMTCLFLARAGKLCSNQAYINECEYQFLLHAKYLADPKTGLWFHGWTFDGRHNFAGGLWGRGNAWITYAIADLLEMGIFQGAFEKYLCATLETQVKALVSFQAENGMWHTLIDDRTTYQEASGTSGMGYGILKAVRLGYLSADYLETGKKAALAIGSRVNENGAVEEVSYGTNVGHVLEEYKNIPFCYMPYGQALAILLLIEYAKA